MSDNYAPAGAELYTVSNYGLDDLTIQHPDGSRTTIPPGGSVVVEMVGNGNFGRVVVE